MPKVLSKKIGEIFTGRLTLSPKVLKHLSKYGNEQIIHISLLRTPVMILIQKLFEQFGNLKNTPYDKLYHLSMIIEFGNGKKLGLEKNEHINTFENPSKQKSSEVVRMDASTVPKITLNEFINNGRQFMGSKFIPYNPKHNNCQDFILGLLKGNGIDNAEFTQFIKQDTNAIFNGNVWLRKLSHTVTDIADRTQLLVGKGVGGGNNPWINHVKKYASEHQISYGTALKLSRESYI